MTWTIESWLINRGSLCHGLLQSLYNWLVFHPLLIHTANNPKNQTTHGQAEFSQLRSASSAVEVKLSKDGGLRDFFRGSHFVAAHEKTPMTCQSKKIHQVMMIEALKFAFYKSLKLKQQII